MSLYEFLMSCVTSVTAKFSSTENKTRNLTDSVTNYDTCVTNSLQKLRTETVSSNDFKVYSGVLFHHGCIKTVPVGGEFLTSTVSNSLGSTGFPLPDAGIYRKDLLVARFTIDSNSFVTSEWTIICGTEATGSPEAPSYTEGDIRNGYQSSSAIDDCPVYEVTVDSTGITNINMIPTIWKMETTVVEGSQNPVTSDAISQVLSGKINVDDLKIETVEGKEGKFLKFTTDDMTATFADIEHIESAYINASAIEARYATITSLDAETARVNELLTDYAKATEIEAKYATIENLNAETVRVDEVLTNYAKASDLEATNATIGNLDATYATVDLSNTRIGATQTALIDDGVIQDAFIGDLSATKITSGQLDCRNITVSNLNADSIVVTKINGVTLETPTNVQDLADTINQNVTTAQNTADGKNKIFYSASEPDATAVGDTWFDTDDGYSIHQWDGTNWVSGMIGSNALSSDVQNTLSQVGTISTDLTSYMNETDAALQSLQGQVDGSIETFFRDGVPTLANYPASSWTTDTIRSNHVGDLYYDSDTGYCYRFMSEQSGDDVNYSWGRITDTDVTTAISNANDAMVLAGNKSRIFYTTAEGNPVPPYDVGDMWTTGSSGDLKICKTAKTDGQSYAAADWEAATKYTDDTVANQAYDLADSASRSAENAVSTATGAADLAQDVADRADSGEFDAVTLKIDSSRGTVFKNNAVSTVLSVVIYHGNKRITTFSGLQEDFGSSAYLEWKWQRMDESTFGVISASDSRFEDHGFRFNLSPQDVDTKCVFLCNLQIN